MQLVLTVVPTWNVLHRLTGLNACSLGGDAVWKGYGIFSKQSLLEERNFEAFLAWPQLLFTHLFLIAGILQPASLQLLHPYILCLLPWPHFHQKTKYPFRSVRQNELFLCKMLLSEGFTSATGNVNKKICFCFGSQMTKKLCF